MYAKLRQGRKKEQSIQLNWWKERKGGKGGIGGNTHKSEERK